MGILEEAIVTLQSDDKKLSRRQKSSVISALTRYAKQKSERDYMYSLIQNQHKGAESTQQRLKWLLDQGPSGTSHSDITTKFFELIVLLEAMKLGVTDINRFIHADKVKIDPATTSNLTFYNIIKTNEHRLNSKRPLKDLERLTKLWVGVKGQTGTAEKQLRSLSRNQHRKPPTGNLFRQIDSHITGEEPTKKYSEMIDRHYSTDESNSYDENAPLEAKINLLLAELQSFKEGKTKLKSNSSDDSSGEEPIGETATDDKILLEIRKPILKKQIARGKNTDDSREAALTYVREHASPSVLFAPDDGDEPDRCHVNTDWQIAHSEPPNAKPRKMSPSSADMICLKVSQMINPDGQWKRLFTKLMCKSHHVIGLTDEMVSLETNYRTEEMQALNALKIWMQAIGGEIDMALLKESLHELKRSDIVKSISKYQKRLTMEPDDDRFSNIFSDADEDYTF